MMMVRKERRDYSWKEGMKTENLFIKACHKIGYKTRTTSKEVDIKKHIDFYVDRPNGTTTSVDVKGGNHPHVIWVEFRNVNGYKGWMYGEAEYIAFQMPELDGFCLVERTDLLQVCREIVIPQYTDKHNAHRKLYQRKGRKDVLTKLHLPDIKMCKTYKLIKYK
jgi:hypothetical protein